MFGENIAFFPAALYYGAEGERRGKSCAIFHLPLEVTSVKGLRVLFSLRKKGEK